MAEVARIHSQESSGSGGHDELLGRVEKELAEIRERLTRIEQAGMGADQAHTDLLTRAIADIRERKAALEAKIQEARTTTKNISGDLKSGLELAWEDLKTSVDSATSRFFH